jgi:chemotaxis protein CheD
MRARRVMIARAKAWSFEHHRSSRSELADETRHRRTADRVHARSVRLLPGDCYATGAADEVIVTVLGSCIAACIRDPRTGYGGMNHFMLPESESGEWNGASAALRYGNHAMEALINDVLKSGCSRGGLEIKLFGGANLTTGPMMVGRKNVDFIRHYLGVEGLRVAAADLGGVLARRIHYQPGTGLVRRIFLNKGKWTGIAEEEQKYVTTLESKPIEGSIELFT